jgi:hypothetical protein
MDEKKRYKTNSLPLAAWLVYAGVKLEEVLKDKKENRAVFEFGWEDNLDRLVEAYFKGEAFVNAESYYLILKSLKSRIYDSGINVE